MAERYRVPGHPGVFHRINRDGKTTYWVAYRDQDDRPQWERCGSLHTALQARERRLTERQRIVQTPRPVRVAQRLGELLNPKPTRDQWTETVAAYEEQDDHEWW